jgi:hypothetical protein
LYAVVLLRPQYALRAAGGSGLYKYEADIFADKSVFAVSDSGVLTATSVGKRDVWVTDVKNSFNGAHVAAACLLQHVCDCLLL